MSYLDSNGTGAVGGTATTLMAARVVTAGLPPGSVRWLRALLDWWPGANRPDSAAGGFVRLIHGLGYQADVFTLDGSGGRRDMVRIHLGGDSETTRGWAVVDVRERVLFTSADGRLAHPEELRAQPDWVAGDPDIATPADAAAPWTLWSTGPRAINFQIGDVCNMHCVMCWQDLRRARQPREQWHPEMTAAAMRDVLERHLHDVDHIELVSFGEPMANPQFDEMVHTIGELGHRRGRRFTLNVITNGSLLHVRRHLHVLHLPGDLTFSIDAADETLYETIREGGRWQDVVRNLRTAVRHPQRHRARRVGINMTVFAANLEAVYAMGAFAAGLGVDYLSILHGDGLDSTRAAGQQLDRAHPSLVEQLNRIRRTFPWLHVNDYATARTLPALPDRAKPGRRFCPLPWRQVDVGPDGRAHPCCRSYAIDLGPAATAWMGEPLQTLRTQILQGDVDAGRYGACAACPNLGNADRRATARRVIPLRAS